MHSKECTPFLAHDERVRVAITGGIAEGKSTVLSYIAEAGFEIASADSIAKAVFVDREVNARLADLLQIDSPVQPDQLRRAIASSPDLRRRANAITHPEILRRIRHSESAFIEIPLLVETALQGSFDQVWVVTCGREEQLRRLTERLGDKALAQDLMAAQLATRAKTPFSDLVIRTNQDDQSVRLLVTESVNRTMQR